MWKNWITILALTLAVSGLYLLVGCTSDDETTGTAPPAEFIADLSDFQDYLTWDRADYTVYPTNLSILGPAHASSDSTMVRQVYSNTNLASVDYQNGDIIVKETFSWSPTGGKDFTNGNLLAMVKRGGDFNPDNAGWEWFDLAPDLSAINARDANLMGGLCNGCHVLATGTLGTDYVFNHPAEYVVEAGTEIDFFTDAVTWQQVDSTFGTDPFLSGAHGDSTDYSRVVYRWQPGAQASDSSYPVGTVILKEVYKLEQGEKSYPPAGGGWTAIVKRGDDFNPTGGNWEWFMMDPATMALQDRGALTLCIGCHSQASTAGGEDFVFPHPGL